MNIAIIGCGYIGFELAKDLVNKKYFVTATTKHSKTLDAVKPIVQKSIILEGSDINEILLILKENDIIILTVGIDKLKDFENTYLKTAQNIKKAALELDTPKMIIYTSKSVIYGDHQGRWVDEDASINAKDDESKILVDTENTLLSLKELNWKVCILRLAHIYGPNRDLTNIMKNLHDHYLPGNGSFYTNMVHQKDVVGAINYVIEHQLQGIFNVVDDDHPTRQELSDFLCQKLNINKVEWDPKKADFPDANKRVSNYRIKEAGFSLSIPYKMIK